MGVKNNLHPHTFHYKSCHHQHSRVMKRKISLNYLRRLTDNYELTLEQAKQIYGSKYEIEDTGKGLLKTTITVC